jgi:hypothetical protein
VIAAGLPASEPACNVLSSDSPPAPDLGEAQRHRLADALDELHAVKSRLDGLLNRL